MILKRTLPWLEEASRKKRWLVGVSGGADSVALLYLLVENGFRNLIVCHLDHRLRGRASTEDAKFVQRLAVRLGLHAEIGREDVRKTMAETGDSLETAARKARHRFFAECAAKHRCVRVVLAHHADDQAETALWNLLRGSRGLKGMAEQQEMKTGEGEVLEIHRPLLSVRRSELVAWLIANKRGWREDTSNAEPIAIRNRLRNEVLPLLSKISGRDAGAAFARGVEEMAEFSEVENWALEKAGVLDPQGRLHVPALKELPKPLQRTAIRNFLQAAGIGNLDRDLLQRCAGLLENGEVPVVNLPGGKYFKRRNGRMVVE
ncbi:MAG: tRNA lysidine(34) synthetase TilS [Luteolibacter sp.]